MRFVKQVIFTIFVVVLLGACGKSKTSEQVITDQNEKARAELEYIRKSTAYVYDSETKTCLMWFGGDHPHGSVAPVPCINVVNKLSPEHRNQYLSDPGRYLEKVQ